MVVVVKERRRGGGKERRRERGKEGRREGEKVYMQAPVWESKFVPFPCLIKYTVDLKSKVNNNIVNNIVNSNTVLYHIRQKHH